MLQVETFSDARCRVVQLTSRGPVAEYEVRDDRGVPIGKVVSPLRQPAIGWGAGTVLLVRPGHPQR